jgi:hypothetical protein
MSQGSEQDDGLLPLSFTDAEEAQLTDGASSRGQMPAGAQPKPETALESKVGGVWQEKEKELSGKICLPPFQTTPSSLHTDNTPLELFQTDM